MSQRPEETSHGNLESANTKLKMPLPREMNGVTSGNTSSTRKESPATEKVSPGSLWPVIPVLHPHPCSGTRQSQACSRPQRGWNRVQKEMGLQEGKEAGKFAAGSSVLAPCPYFSFLPDSLPLGTWLQPGDLRGGAVRACGSVPISAPWVPISKLNTSRQLQAPTSRYLCKQNTPIRILNISAGQVTSST